MDQISLTELRRFYFGPTLAESILYGYDCLQEFFGWNGSAEKKNIEPEDSNSLQQFESIEALDESIVNPQIKTEQDLDESIGKELVVASMSNDRTTQNYKRNRKSSSIIEEIVKDNQKQVIKLSEDSKIGQSSKQYTKPEVELESLSPQAKKLTKDFRKSSSIIVEGIKSALKTSTPVSDHSSVEQTFHQSSIHSAENDVLPIKSSRELRRASNGLRIVSDVMSRNLDQTGQNILVKSEMPTTSMKSNKRASDTSTNEFISFESSGEKKRSSKDLRTLSSTSVSRDLSSLNSKFKSCHSGSIGRMSLINSKETTPQRPTTSPTSETRNSLPSPTPQRRRSSSSRRHSSPHDPKGTSATTPQQSRHRPRLTATRWAIARVNEFDDGAKTYEILPDAAKLLPAVEGRKPLDVLRRMQKLQKTQPVPELTATEIIFATLPGGHTISYKSDEAKSR